MPRYRFPPDVPTPPKGNSFRPRPDVDDRDGSLPRKHAGTDPLQNRVRVRVPMFMLPIVFLLTLSWVASAADGESRELGGESVSSYLLILFGSALCIGGFLGRALRIRRGRSSAKVTSAVDSPAQSVTPRPVSLHPQK